MGIQIARSMLHAKLSRETSQSACTAGADRSVSVQGHVQADGGWIIECQSIPFAESFDVRKNSAVPRAHRRESTAGL